MTNPDNVGGLLPCPGCGKSDLDHCPADFVAVNGLTRGMIVRCAWCHFAAPEAAWNRRELCRAAPAGGVSCTFAHGDDWPCSICGTPRKDSAPAGSGEVDLEEFREAVDLLRITSLGGKRDCERHGTFPHDFDRSLAKADRLLALIDSHAALLRKLQQGADGWRPIDSAPKDGSYVLVANSHGSWIARWHPVYQSGYRPSNPWMSMMLNHDHIEKPGRYDLPSQWRPIPHPAASQGQEGGA